MSLFASALFALALGNLIYANAAQAATAKKDQKEDKDKDKDRHDDGDKNVCKADGDKDKDKDKDKSATKKGKDDDDKDQCRPGSACCSGKCVDPKSDNNNCGACGRKCAPGTRCNGGACVSICAPGQTFCGLAGCVDENRDNNNCGACGHVCDRLSECVGGTCLNVCRNVCAPGTTFCGTRCENTQTDNNNCGKCGNVCPSGTMCAAGACVPICGPGQTLCGTTCVDTETDKNNCGACGIACTAPDTCIAGSCTPPSIAASCLPTSSLSVLIGGGESGHNVTAYVPLGSWSEATTGVRVVPLEPTGPSTTILTTGPVNSCSSNSATGTTVCTGNNNDVYVINGTTLTATSTAHGSGTLVFSGGSCTSCGVAFDADSGLAWIAESHDAGTPPDVAQLEPLNPPATFGSSIGLFGQEPSENVSIDPVRHYILSANESNHMQIVNTSTRIVYNGPLFPPPPGTSCPTPPGACPPVWAFGELDSTAEDCSTGLALAPFEFTQSIGFANLSTGAVTFAGGVADTAPGTWTAPINVQNFAPDFDNLIFGTNGSAVAPGSHMAVITGEFGGAAFGLLQLPATVTPATVPAATDWVSANVPDPAPSVAWSMGKDPHTVTAYTSPNGGKAYALMSNVERTYLVKVDMAALLAAPRLAGTHRADPGTAAYAAAFTFIAQ